MTGWRHLYRLQRLIALTTSDKPTASDSPKAETSQPLSSTRILKAWLPLAATWVLMTGEGPLMAAAVARQFEPELNLAAWSLVFPIVLILGAPGLTLLSASTSLVRDIDSYYKVRKFVFWMIGGITLLHILLAFTPVFDFLMTHVVGAPAELFEPVRLGFRIMLPFTSVLAYRRFCNGILIRFGRSNAITIGAIFRLMTNATTLVVTWLLGFSGIAMAASSITASVIAEFTYAMLITRGIIDTKLRPAPKTQELLTLHSFLAFYFPLVLTTIIYVFMQPMIAAALSRMPDPISSLAGWPVLYGIVMLVGSSAFAFTEVVVVMLDEPNSQKSLMRFTAVMATCAAGVLLLFSATDLANLWLRNVAALPEALIPAVRNALWFAIPLPALTALDSLFSGTLMKSRQTRGVTEAALLSIVTVGLVLVAGVFLGEFPGLLIGILATFAGNSMRTAWLGRRAWRTLTS